ncbi:MAG TPA: SIMPL domain-containing protein, partial [Pirellulales bacterium]
KLLDGIRDAGLTTGPDPNNPNAQAEGQLANAVVMFVADNLEQARKQATAAAFQNAKEKAQRIAELAEGKLGAAAAVEESPSLNAMNDEAAALGMLTAIYAGGSVGAENPSLKSAILVELPVRVNLRVRFNLQSRGGEK